MKKESEFEVQNIVESLCPDPNLRAIYLTMISDGIMEANRYDRGIWSVNVNNGGVRLTVAHYYVCTIEQKGIWLALNDIFLRYDENEKRYHPSMDQLNKYGWKMDVPGEPGAYPTYKDRTMNTDFSANGFYSPGKNHSDAWKHIRKLFLDLIYKAIYHGQPMAKDSPGKHCPGFLKYVRNQYGIPLLDPFYTTYL
jgi:hypothetical protein